MVLIRVMGLMLSLGIMSQNSMADCTGSVSTPAASPCPHHGKISRQAETFYIDGLIDGMTYDYLSYDRVIDKIQRIELNSFGGDVTVAYWLAEMIRTHNITTNVRQGAICASVCTLLYQAGVNRMAHISAQFGYHGVRVGGVEMIRQYQKLCDSGAVDDAAAQSGCGQFTRKWVGLCQQSTDELFQQYQVYGASPRLYQTYSALPEETGWAKKGNCFKVVNWLLTAEEAVSYDIVQTLVGDQNPFDESLARVMPVPP